MIRAALYYFVNGPGSISDCSVKATLVDTNLRVRGAEVPTWADKAEMTSNTVDLSIRKWVGDGDTAVDIVENDGPTSSGNDVNLGSRRSFDAASGLDSTGLGDELFNP